MEKNGISVIIPVSSKSSSPTFVIMELNQILRQFNIPFEIILVDSTSEKIKPELSSIYPKVNIKFLSVSSFTTKSSALLQGFSQSQFKIVAITYPGFKHLASYLPSMLQKIIYQSVDIVIAQPPKLSFSAKLFGSLQKEQILDIHSGLKVFKKEITDRLYPRFKPISFDLEFLAKARDAGYAIAFVEISESDSSPPIRSSHQDGFFQLLLASIKLRLTRSQVIPFHNTTTQQKGQGFHYKGQEFVHHSALHPSQSALHRFSGMQIFILTCLSLEIIFFFFTNWFVALVLLIGVLTLLYFIDLMFNLYLIYRSFTKPAEIHVTHQELESVTHWPLYTVLCPLYKEWQVVPQFVQAMSNLDYPKSQMQVLLLLEEDDTQTIFEVNKLSLPEYIKIVVVPDSRPKTKPKAANYGLTHSDGEFVVIYDAEDIPDPLQLKKSVISFMKSDPKTICIQAKLNFYNPHQNILTRVFTAEYSLWFDLILTGLQSIKAPIPLGGTSNHFRVRDLKKIKGWDSFNVTEDCDLGIRLVQQGFHTAIVESTTLEEANSSLLNWFGQRSRWIKGYIQSYFVHMRDPQAFFQNGRKPDLFSFQLIVGGKILSMLVNPFMWLITVLYFGFRSSIGYQIESLFPPVIFYPAVSAALIGNFVYLYYYMIGCARTKRFELIKYVYLVPFYWLLMSMAAWFALYKIITQPHYWYKTKHGLHLDNTFVNQLNPISTKLPKVAFE